MKRFIPAALALVALISSLAIAGEMEGGKAAAASADFDRIKALAGTWDGTTKDGKSVHITYTVTAGGSAVLETLKHGDEPDMVTVYHMDRTRLMMTHYCSAMNQPRMIGKGEGKSIVFNFLDATNMDSKDAMHMHKLVLTMPDGDHLTQEWTLHMNGKDMPVVFELERKS